jgi:membrane protease YdiL (CAAX protease family)
MTPGDDRFDDLSSRVILGVIVFAGVVSLGVLRIFWPDMIVDDSMTTSAWAALLCGLYTRYRSIWAPAIAHAGINMLATGMSLMAL